MFKSKKLTFLLCTAAIIVGSLLRLLCVEATPYHVSAHDLGYFHGLQSTQIGAGHLGYIEYLFKHRGLPDFSPAKIWSFYNPPLYHGVSAAFLGIFTGLGQSYEAAWESLQFLPWLFIFLAVLGAFLSLRELDIDGLPLFLSTLIFSFHPTLTYLSLTMNNDPLSLAFSVWAVYFTIRWYKKPTFLSILGIALCIGLGMMTKLTTALIAPPVAILFLYRLLKNRQWKTMIPQFAVFALVCCPLGLFWSVRNLVLYDMPIGYIQSLPSGSAQNISAFSVKERFGLPALSDFVRLRSYWSASGETGAPDHNFWSQTLRTALFDDNLLSFSDTSASATMGRILMIVALILGAMTVTLAVIGLIRATKTDLMIRLFIGVAVLTVIVNYVTFCFSYPFTCTIHFRYVVSAVPLFAAAVGLWWKSAKDTSPVLSVKCVYACLSLAFCLLSAILYLNL